MAHLRLTIEPIPRNSRLATLANLLPRDHWDTLRRSVYRRAGHRCQACGAQGRLHCHEVWQFNPKTRYQSLRGFQALCARCHAVKHLTFVHDPHTRAHLLQHFIAVNRLTRDQAQRLLQQAHRRQAQLDKGSWIVHYGHFNMRTPAVPTVQQRHRYAAAIASRPRP